MRTQSIDAVVSKAEMPPLITFGGQPAHEGYTCPDAGVYMIRSRLNKRFYVGASRNMTRRIAQHLNCIHRQSYKQPLIRSAFEKHTKDDIELRVLERFPNFNSQAVGHKEFLRDAELDWIRRLAPPLNARGTRSSTVYSFDLPHGLPDDLKQTTPANPGAELVKA